MCGIFAYINYHERQTVREIFNVLLDGLQRVEYRGYDSAGLCIDGRDADQPPVLIRSVGNIAQLRKLVFSDETVSLVDLDASFDVHVGIAHTRWATHGMPSVKNCHPQASNDQGFVVVHNGIMTNFMPVKQMLLERGYHFSSDTDTEVIAVLLEYLHTQEPKLSLVELATRITSILEGAYALLVKSMFFPNELIACRKSSPLMVGFRRGGPSGAVANGDALPLTELYFASDANSFIAHTREVIFLENGDIAHFHDGALALYATSNTTAGLNNSVAVATPVSRAPQIIDATPEGLSKDGYEHFMLKEIYEQPESVTRTMRGRINFLKGDVNFDGMDASILAALSRAHCLMLISCGTSYHSCLAVRPIFEELLRNLSVVVENAPYFMDRQPRVHRDDVCVFVSQSGETADTIMALQHSKAAGATLIGVTNVPGSTVSRQTDYAISLNAGVEVGVASTKAYTSQIVLLTLLALLMSQTTNSSWNDKDTTGNIRGNTEENKKEVEEGKEENNQYVQKRRAEIISGLTALPAAISQCLKFVSDAVISIAEEWHDASTILVIGRGYDYPTALESALKVKEVSYVFTEGIHSGELKHGPLALVDANSRVIAFCAHDRHFELSKSAIQQVKARGGRVVAVTTQKDAEVENATTLCVEVPKVVDCLQGVVNVVPLQLLAYYLAVRRGHNVDCPRNLAKSVTVQ
ncbi:putative glucosamine-fructose-6-phosphate aminotransferase [Trypanosoma cruzi]|uniref:glutamine--fructose-6-phosphate transaminase (isomerizing) n=2 Tax=Trypanosoma cruzi TaxID=5693 RepID=V5DPM3_TRYCR|nr:glucosamine-fructose-6-phosphate aminotransferase [Trypanosoma cruzi Dm28c]PBJ71737.1 glucosamine-fructose-6-phosphate aminotransferase [Trypanosoma cruzi cruzi]PWU93617.1 putative glucosamine-fructose-6-phosphate aminotransferase [Trypanosoma cruzi]RNF23321.1 putative glucosamine-fructose-6-phosphate aminotransferase [Trypanosoma cruzi]